MALKCFKNLPKNNIKDRPCQGKLKEAPVMAGYCLILMRFIEKSIFRLSPWR
jgi:hypothetical protein